MRELTKEEKREEKLLCSCAYMDVAKYIDPQGIRHWVLCPARKFDSGKTGSLGIFRYKEGGGKE